MFLCIFNLIYSKYYNIFFTLTSVNFSKISLFVSQLLIASVKKNKLLFINNDLNLFFSKNSNPLPV